LVAVKAGALALVFYQVCAFTYTDHVYADNTTAKIRVEGHMLWRTFQYTEPCWTITFEPVKQSSVTANFCLSQCFAAEVTLRTY
jgi:hypothetical protein